MNLEEIEIILFEFKVISGLFLAVTTLLLYVWKTESKRNEKMFDRHGKILEEIRLLTAVHEVEIENLKSKK